MIKVGKITKEQLRTADRKARREQEISEGMNFNRHRVWKSKKSYKRKPKYKQSYE